jgi:hypothetical protein
LVNKVQIPRPDDKDAESLRRKVWNAFESKAEGMEKLDSPAACSSYDWEWIAARNVQDPPVPQTNITDREKFNVIEQNRRNDLTLFYLSRRVWL